MCISHVIVLVVAGLVGQAPDQPPFVKEHAKTITFYYKAPNPGLGPKLLKELLKKENLEHPWFAKNDYALLLNAALLGDIAAGKAKIVRQYEAAFTDAPAAGRRVIIHSLRNCGDQETLKRIDAWLADPRYADSRRDLQALKKHLEDPGRNHVRDRPARTPDDLDLLWGNFFITGEYVPVSRILDVLDLTDAPDNMLLKRVAWWSLGSNLQQHPRLAELVQEHAKKRPERSRKAVDELIRTIKEVLGRWVSQDKDKEPLIFEKDGTFRCGFIKEKGEWVMARGQYTFLVPGKIDTVARHEGSTLYQTFTLKDGVITGSRGTKQNVEWKKDQP
jgi:hypothetical protein